METRVFSFKQFHLNAPHNNRGPRLVVYFHLFIYFFTNCGFLIFHVVHVVLIHSFLSFFEMVLDALLWVVHASFSLINDWLNFDWIHFKFLSISLRRMIFIKIHISYSSCRRKVSVDQFIIKSANSNSYFWINLSVAILFKAANCLLSTKLTSSIGMPFFNAIAKKNCILWTA